MCMPNLRHWVLHRRWIPWVGDVPLEKSFADGLSDVEGVFEGVTVVKNLIPRKVLQEYAARLVTAWF
jgi:hypothetical protein